MPRLRWQRVAEAMSVDYANGLAVGIVLGATLGLVLGLVIIPVVVDGWYRFVRRVARARDVR